MSYTEIEDIKSGNIAATVTRSDFLFKSSRKEEFFRKSDIANEEVNQDKKSSQSPETVVIRDVYGSHPKPAQETPEEYEYRLRQTEYEQNGAYAQNAALAKSINNLAVQNFSNRLLAAACDFTEMAENHPRSVFIQNFGPLIEEELKADPSKPSQRLASFATTYFWEEANLKRMAESVPPEATRDELLEFFKLPLHSNFDKKIADCLPDRVIGEIVYSTRNEDNKNIRINFRKNFPRVSLDESEKLEESITKLSQQNFTNRLLTSTMYFRVIMNPFNTIRAIKEFAPAIQQELQANNDKPAPSLATLITERGFSGKDTQKLIDTVTPETTKDELAEFFTTRESWSTGLRMIDYLNHHVVTEMARFLPDKDKLDLWSLRPELINGFQADRSLKKLSPECQEKILDTVQDPVRKKALRDDMQAKRIGLHITGGLTDTYTANPELLDIPAQFSCIRRRRICSHQDNIPFFRAQENFRSSF